MIVLNGSTGITANNLGVETIVDSAGTGAPSVPNGFEQMFVLPVGTLMWFTGDTAPGGYLVADGSLHSRAAYPDLWSWIVTSGNLAVSDALWDEGQYSPGDGSTTFRVPKVDDRFIRGKSSTRAVGLVEEDAFQGHDIELAASDGATSTALTNTATTGLAGWSNGFFGYISDASNPSLSDGYARLASDGINGTPRTANETRPKALTMLPCIKAFDSVIEPSILNAAEMVSTINGKLDKDQNIVLGTSVVASGTAVDFVGIPEGAKRITVMFDGVSTNGSSNIIIRMGSGTIETTGYLSNASFSSVELHSTVGFLTAESTNAGSMWMGVMVLSLLGANTWAVFGSNADASGTRVDSLAGSKPLSGPLDRIRITTVNGTDQFDAGSINISWEF